MADATAEQHSTQLRCHSCKALLAEHMGPQSTFRIRCWRCKATNVSVGRDDVDLRIILTARPR